MEQYLGSIYAFGFNFAPSGWALCNGQLLAISQYQALFALIGTFYGGDGVSTFALPNLQGRTIIHQGNGAGLPPFTIGQIGGNTTATLSTSNMPAHNHQIMADGTEIAANGTKVYPGPAHILGASRTDTMYSVQSPSTNLNPQSMSIVGGSQPFSIQNPFVVVNYCIALVGIFPSRN